MVRSLWPDSIVSIHGAAGDWYRVPGGFVLQSDLQPVLPYDPAASDFPGALPAWLAVVAPVAALRAWVAPNAPVVARVGYSGVMCAVDALHDDNGSLWYGVSHAADHGLIGWSPAVRWSSVDMHSRSAAAETKAILLNRAAGQVSAWQGRREMLRTPAVAPVEAQAGEFPLLAQHPGADIGGRCGVPWVLETADPVIYGVHWHNTFGCAGQVPGWEVSPWAARWLYEWASRHTVVYVR